MSEDELTRLAFTNAEIYLTSLAKASGPSSRSDELFELAAKMHDYRKERWGLSDIEKRYAAAKPVSVQKVAGRNP